MSRPASGKTVNSKSENLHFFGIRHHGPGCAKALKDALRELKPDILLFECPSDAAPALDLFLIEEVETPLAIMIFNPKSPDKAVFFPLTSFSPEWIALKYSFENSIPLIPIDLPTGLKADKILPSDSTKFDSNDTSLWDYLGSAGIEEPERWWDRSIEESQNPLGVFEEMGSLMEEWRSLEGESGTENKLREAHMRIQIRKAQRKYKGQKIAIVCGAYHLPALNPAIGKKEDVELLKGHKPTRMEANWIPWSFRRLSKGSGYGAGVEFPGFYQHLFEHGYQNPQKLIAEMANCLRRRNKDISPARVIDATHMAYSLAQIRNRRLPLLQDIKEATIVTLAQNDLSSWEAIVEDVLIGKNFGDSGPYKERHPIERDFQENLKRFRLSSTVKKGEKKSKKLDLRKENHLLLSQFLHQLIAIEVPLGLQVSELDSTISSFAENWDLLWTEDYHIDLLEAGLYGNTVTSAASNKTLQSIPDQPTLYELSKAIMSSLLAGLEKPLDQLLRMLEEKASVSGDLDEIIPALTTISLAARYGDVRNFNPTPLYSLVSSLLPRVLIGLPGLGVNIDSERAKGVLSHFQAISSVVGFISRGEVKISWVECLKTTFKNPMVHPLIKGYVGRQLQDKSLIDYQELKREISLVFSQGNRAENKAQWLEGFLTGGLITLFYDRGILQTLNQFVDGLPEEEFTGILPILRRTFSETSGNDKYRLMNGLVSAQKDESEQEKKEDSKDNLKRELDSEFTPALLLEILN
jgi:hypothetical protein